MAEEFMKLCSMHRCHVRLENTPHAVNFTASVAGLPKRRPKDRNIPPDLPSTLRIAWLFEYHSALALHIPMQAGIEAGCAGMFGIV